MTGYRYAGAFPSHTHKRFARGPSRMQQTECTDTYSRRVIRREWWNTDDQLHRTTGPAVEAWTILPGGAHVLSGEAWYLNDILHSEGQPAYRQWHVVDNGTRVLKCERWRWHGKPHRLGGPSYRRWTMEPDGTRRLAWERWCVDGKLHRVDGPAYDRLGFYWHDKGVEGEDLPWVWREKTCRGCGVGGASWSL